MTTDRSPMVIIASVMHTGTHLISELLQGEQYIFHMPSICGRFLHEKHWLESNLMVTPLRHPRKVAESFRRRGTPFNDFCSQWINMMEYYGQYADAHIVVDGPNRDAQLAEFAEATGRDAKTDWPIVGSKHQTHRMRVEDCPVVPNEFIEYYERRL